MRLRSWIEIAIMAARLGAYEKICDSNPTLGVLLYVYFIITYCDFITWYSYVFTHSKVFTPFCVSCTQHRRDAKRPITCVADPSIHFEEKQNIHPSLILSLSLCLSVARSLSMEDIDTNRDNKQEETRGSCS